MRPPKVDHRLENTRREDNLTGIVIAAGRGQRMLHLTLDRPKCLLPIGNRVILDIAIDNLKRAGCRRIVIVTGYLHDLVERHVAGDSAITCLFNEGAASMNVLHSLMQARSFFIGPLLITYSDTVASWKVVQTISETSGDVVIGVDRDWRAAYHGRLAHPMPEAEKVHVDENGRSLAFGKHLLDCSTSDMWTGEFVGMLRTSAKGSATLLSMFDAIGNLHIDDAAGAPIAGWRNAYLTDLFRHCVARGKRICAASVQGGWRELDTPEDYCRLTDSAEAQDLGLGDIST